MTTPTIYLSIYISYQFIFLSMYFFYQSMYLSIYLSTYLSFFLSIYLSILDIWGWLHLLLAQRLAPGMIFNLFKTFLQYCDSNICPFSIAHHIAKVVFLNLCFIITSFLHFHLFSYCSSNYRNNDSCLSFLLLKTIAKSKAKFVAIAFKS